jgi:two-component system nitrate/nitrite response regulator NarL
MREKDETEANSGEVPIETSISVLLAIDFPILRDALRSIIEGTEGLRLTGCVETREELEALAPFMPDLVIVDASFAGESLLDVIDKIIAQNSRVLMIGGEEDKTLTLKALIRGLNGVIGRKSTPDLVRRSIRAVVSGEIWVSRQLTSTLIDSLRSGTTDTGALEKTVALMFQKERKEPALPAEHNYGLTRRELQIIGALVEGQTNKDIAATFGVSEYTVKHHLTNVFDKLGVYNRVELVLFAISHHLVAPPEEATRNSGKRRLSENRG